ncbi:hypothetical protein RPB_3281 [Rhodopseudomonas palustris HaA2]|uniref:Uncharacterized protein n=1 Tax=Rhodopseudomonas palustris (strain HaA2) TaxID=316058 RepID=Q2IUY3_RHOP2|nr:hypothetical protein RPB_3281 [Rhodopseudomonas palustris HaA2]
MTARDADRSGDISNLRCDDGELRPIDHGILRCRPTRRHQVDDCLRPVSWLADMVRIAFPSAKRSLSGSLIADDPPTVAGAAAELAKARRTAFPVSPLFREAPKAWQTEHASHPRASAMRFRERLPTCAVTSTAHGREHLHLRRRARLSPPLILRPAGRRALVGSSTVPLAREVKQGMRYGAKAPKPRLPPQL